MCVRGGGAVIDQQQCRQQKATPRCVIIFGMRRIFQRGLVSVNFSVSKTVCVCTLKNAIYTVKHDEFQEYVQGTDAIFLPKN